MVFRRMQTTAQHFEVRSQCLGSFGGRAVNPGIRGLRLAGPLARSWLGWVGLYLSPEFPILVAASVDDVRAELEQPLSVLCAKADV